MIRKEEIADNVGHMRHRVRVQQYVETRNDFGEEILTWSTYKTLWAAVDTSPKGSNEYELSKRLVAKTSALFYVRYRDDLDEKMTIVWKGKRWQILSLVPDNRLDILIIEVEHYMT